MSKRKTKEARKQKRVLGIWDLNAAPVRLGGLLILAEELQMHKHIHGADYADIGIVGDISDLLTASASRLRRDSIIPLDEVIRKDSAPVSVLLDIEGIDNCYYVDSIAVLRNFVRAGSESYILWPELGEEGLVKPEYGNTMFAQDFYRERGFTPSLSCKAEPLHWAVDFIERNVKPSLPVAVHLKNNPDEKGCSNADFNAWFDFFKACVSRYEVKFILVGNEDIDSRIAQLPNVILSRNFQSNISRDLAIIQISCAFMGMASGPCNMAIFSDILYVIYKNPGHDVEQMELELGDRNQFVFAAEFQKILRVYETGENLTTEFTNLSMQFDIEDWEKRLEKLQQINPV